MKLKTATFATTMVLFTAWGSGCAAPSGGGADGDADYPNGDVRVIVPFDAGSNTDNVGRSISTCLEEETGQSFLVENQSGGGGVVGSTEVANAQPDGYTLGLLTTSPTVTAPLLSDDVSYTTEDFQPIGIVAEIPYVMFVAADSEYTDANQLIDAAADRPGAINLSTSGKNTLSGLAIGETMKKNYDISFGQVPVDSNTEMLRGVRAGDYPAAFTTASQEVLEAEAAGDVRILATSSEEPPKILADTPSFTSVGYENLLPPAGQGAVYYLTGPSGIPDTVAENLKDPMERCISNEKLIERIGEPFVPDKFSDGESTAKQLSDLKSILSKTIKQ